jgi:hypothetical protein
MKNERLPPAYRWLKWPVNPGHKTYHDANPRGANGIAVESAMSVPYSYRLPYGKQSGDAMPHHPIVEAFDDFF